jgi:hypothetical protein
MDISVSLLLGGIGFLVSLGTVFITLILSDHRQRMKRVDRNRHA